MLLITPNRQGGSNAYDPAIRGGAGFKREIPMCPGLLIMANVVSFPRIRSTSPWLVRDDTVLYSPERFNISTALHSCAYVVGPAVTSLPTPKPQLCIKLKKVDNIRVTLINYARKLQKDIGLRPLESV